MHLRALGHPDRSRGQLGTYSARHGSRCISAWGLGFGPTRGTIVQPRSGRTHGEPSAAQSLQSRTSDQAHLNEDGHEVPEPYAREQTAFEPGHTALIETYTRRISGLRHAQVEPVRSDKLSERNQIAVARQVISWWHNGQCGSRHLSATYFGIHG
jgi:hypothetical protein